MYRFRVCHSPVLLWRGRGKGIEKPCILTYTRGAKCKMWKEGETSVYLESGFFLFLFGTYKDCQLSKPLSPWWPLIRCANSALVNQKLQSKRMIVSEINEYQWCTSIVIIAIRYLSQYTDKQAHIRVREESSKEQTVGMYFNT